MNARHDEATDAAWGAAAQAMFRAAQAVSRPGGSDVFVHLVHDLADILSVTTCFVAVYTDEARHELRTLAAVLDGRALRSFDYTLEGSPCAQVVGHAYRHVARGVAGEFRPDTIFAAKGMDSYAAFPLFDSRDQPLGLLVVMDRQPIADATLAEALLKIFAGRIVAEIEQLRAHDAVRRSESSYRAIFESSEDAIFVHDWDSGAVLDVNPKACATYGYSRDELSHISLADISSGVPPYTAEQGLRYIEQAKQGMSPVFEWQRRNKDGSLHWDEVRLKAAEIDGKPHVLAFTREITGHKTALAALQAQEQKYRAIFDGSGDAMVLWSEDLRVVDVNDAFVKLIGLAREQVVGRHWSERPDLDDLHRLLPAIRGALAGREGRAVERVSRADGSRFDMELRYLPVRLGGAPYALGVGRDVTEQLEREGELVRHAARLRDSEEQYRAIFNASADALVLRDAGFRIVDVNATYERMSGWTRDEVVGLDRIVANPAEVAPTIRALHERALGGEPIALEVPLVRRDGRRYELELRGVPIQHRGEPHVLYIGRDITQAKQAEHALRDSEQQYRAIFDASADALILWDSQYRRVDVNPAYERIFGWTRDEVIGRGYDRPDDGEAYAQPRRDLVRRALAGETCRAELVSRRKDGSIIQIEVHATPFRHRGEPHVLAIARDVTARRLAEERLRAREEQYRVLFDGSSDAMIVWNGAQRIVDVNAAFAQMSGYERHEVLGLALRDFIGGSQSTAAAAAPQRPRGFLDEESTTRCELGIAQALHGHIGQIEMRAVNRAGDAIDIEMRYMPINVGDQPHVLAVSRDVTERRERERQLQRSEARLRATVQAAFDCVIGMDGEGRIVEFNAAAERCFGHAREQVLGRLLSDVILPERHRDAHNRGLKHFHGIGHGPMVGRLVETSAQRADGSEFPVELAISVATAPEGNIFVGHLRDISARRAAEAERSALEAQLRQAQKMEAIGQLTGGIAHDFNNILTAVIGYVVLGQERAAGSGDAKLARQLESAHLAAQRARDLIAQMLTFARGQSGARRVIALAPLVRQSLQLLRSTLPSSVVLETAIGEVDDTLPAVLADAVQLEQVLFNLCINARDAMRGSGTIRVSVREVRAPKHRCASCGTAIDAGPWLALDVADSGPGIAPEVVERMFEPFFSTKEVGRGSGMGLAMVHGIVHNHGGHVLVDTQPGQGTRFRVLWPAARVGAAAAVPAAAALADTAQLHGRVMVVEDEPAVGDLMAELLDGWGLQVVLMRDPLAAQRWLDDDANALDLMITDHTMPGITGLALAQHASAARPALPVLLCTGDPETEDTEVLRRHGVQALLRKPVEPQALRLCLQRWLTPR